MSPSIFAQNDVVEGGFGFNIGGGGGTVYRGDRTGSLAMYYFGCHWVPAKVKLLNFMLYMQNGSTSIDSTFNHTFFGLEIVTRPLINKFTRFQPYIGARIGGSSVGYIRGNDDIDDDFRTVLSPVIGLEYYITGKFSLEVAYKYDLMSNDLRENPKPSVNASIFSLGIKWYMIFD